jgi:hypothetical protein
MQFSVLRVLRLRWRRWRTMRFVPILIGHRRHPFSAPREADGIRFFIASCNAVVVRVPSEWPSEDPAYLPARTPVQRSRPRPSSSLPPRHLPSPAVLIRYLPAEGIQSQSLPLRFSARVHLLARVSLQMRSPTRALVATLLIMSFGVALHSQALITTAQLVARSTAREQEVARLQSRTDAYAPLTIIPPSTSQSWNLHLTVRTVQGIVTNALMSLCLGSDAQERSR